MVANHLEGVGRVGKVGEVGGLEKGLYYHEKWWDGQGWAGVGKGGVQWWQITRRG